MSRNEWAIETVCEIELKILSKSDDPEDKHQAALLRRIRRKNEKGEDFTAEETEAYESAKEDVIVSLNDM